jgi:hypothetical protein
MNGYEVITGCCEAAGYPLSHEQKILVAGAVHVLVQKVVEDERQACIKACEEQRIGDVENSKLSKNDWYKGAVRHCVEAIKERGKK